MALSITEVKEIIKTSCIIIINILEQEGTKVNQFLSLNPQITNVVFVTLDTKEVKMTPPPVSSERRKLES